MGSDLETRIAKLGRLVAEARELADVAKYFHDQLVPFPPFLDEGVQAEHKPLQQLVRGIATSYDVKIPEGQGKLLHLPRFSLWHGALGHAIGPMAVIIYFDDQHRGVASFGTISNPRTHYIRFSLPEQARDPNHDLGGMKIESARVGPRGSA
ncbi:MAG: hypothetical protein KIT84_32195 [Labilithrix sp.]|nr:hypothetical protein [Labilithrix sp.]MCW5815734.1 hypothetical protein [Labilithrix sp.]